MQLLLVAPIAFGVGVALALPEAVDDSASAYASKTLTVQLAPTIVFDHLVNLHVWALVLCFLMFRSDDALLAAAVFDLSVAYAVQTDLDRKVRFWYTHRSYVAMAASFLLWLAMTAHVIWNTSFVTLHWCFVGRTLCSVVDAYQFDQRIKFNR